LTQQYMHKIKRRILRRMTSFGRTKVKKRPRVTKYIKSGKAYFPRACKDIQELA